MDSLTLNCRMHLWQRASDRDLGDNSCPCGSRAVESDVKSEEKRKMDLQATRLALAEAVSG